MQFILENHCLNKCIDFEIQSIKEKIHSSRYIEGNQEFTKNKFLKSSVKFMLPKKTRNKCCWSKENQPNVLLLLNPNYDFEDYPTTRTVYLTRKH